MNIEPIDYLHEATTPVQIFLILYKANAKLLRNLEDRLERLELTLGRLCLLVALKRNGKAMLPSELSDDLAVTRANISGLLKALESNEMVRRDFDPANRRQILVSLTQKGSDALEQAWPIYEESMQLGLNALTQDEQLTLLSLLKKI